MMAESLEVARMEAAQMDAVADNFLRAWQKLAPGFQQAWMVELQNFQETSCEHHGAEIQAAAPVEAGRTEAVADNFLHAWQNLAPGFQQA
jgi:hypothetical protein